MTDNISNLIDVYMWRYLRIPPKQKEAKSLLGLTSLVYKSSVPEPIDGVVMIVCGPKAQTLVWCRPGVGFDRQPVTIWNILCTVLAMAG